MKPWRLWAGTGGLLPEQIWDSAPIPERHLSPGKPSGSVMPIVWTHSEYIKLCYSRVLDYPVDRPAATWYRYQGIRPEITHDLSRPRFHPRNIHAGNVLIIALRASARVHWGINSWKDVKNVNSKKTGLGIHIAELPITELNTGESVQFTFYWLDQEKWEILIMKCGLQKKRLLKVMTIAWYLCIRN